MFSANLPKLGVPKVAATITSYTATVLTAGATNSYTVPAGCVDIIVSPYDAITGSSIPSKLYTALPGYANSGVHVAYAGESLSFAIPTYDGVRFRLSVTGSPVATYDGSVTAGAQSGTVAAYGSSGQNFVLVTGQQQGSSITSGTIAGDSSLYTEYASVLFRALTSINTSVNNSINYSFNSTLYTTHSSAEQINLY